MNLLLRPSANLVIKEVEVFWEKARIPAKKLQRSIENLESLYTEWKNLQKSCKRRTEFKEKIIYTYGRCNIEILSKAVYCPIYLRNPLF